MKKRLSTLVILMALLIPQATFAGGAGSLLGKVITAGAELCEGYDIYDVYDHISQKLVHYSDIRFGKRKVVVEKLYRDMRYPKKNIWIKRTVVQYRPTIVLYEATKKMHYWVDIWKMSAYHQGANILMPFTTVGWKKLTQHQANTYFQPKVMKQLASAYEI